MIINLHIIQTIFIGMFLLAQVNTSPPTLCDTTFFATFDFEAWRGDVRGCNYVRWGLYKEVLAHEDCFIGMDTLRLKELLGEPDFRFNNSTRFAYGYWLECGPREGWKEYLKGRYYISYMRFVFKEKEMKSIECGFP